MKNINTNFAGGGSTLLRRRMLMNLQTKNEPLILFENGKFNSILGVKTTSPYIWYAASRGGISQENNLIKIWHDNYVSYGWYFFNKIDISMHKKLKVEFDIPYTGKGFIYFNFFDTVIKNNGGAIESYNKTFDSKNCYSETRIKADSELVDNVFTANLPDKTNIECAGNPLSYFVFGFYYGGGSNKVETTIKKIWLE